MRARLIRLAYVGALLSLAVGSAWLRAQATTSRGAQFVDSTNDLSVTEGKTVLVDTAEPVARVSVGLGDVAVVSAASPTELMVNGKKAGETSLIIWDIKGGRQFFNVRVRPSAAAEDSSLEGLRRELHAELPQQPVQVSMENGDVFLRGTVKDVTSAERAAKIAATAGKVVNLLDVDVPKTDPQILLKVRFASVDRTRERQLGLNLFSTGFGNVLGGISTGQFSPPTVATSNGTTTATVSDELNLYAFLPGKNLGGTLKALETEGVVEVLAEPNLLAANGKEATFLAGGEFPYPVVQGTTTGTTITIDFKEYGIRLNFIPTIMPQGTIRLQVAPEVSTLDYTNEVEISGFTVPGISTRKVNTEVFLKDGQSFAIGGLIDNSVSQTFEKIPFLSQIPVLGKFFQSIQRTKSNTELIVIVTPEVVAPVPAGQQLPVPVTPVPYMEANSKTPMHTPDAKTAENTLEPAPTTIPLEKLQESLKPEKPLVIESESGVFGASSTTGTGSQSGSSTQSTGGTQ